MMNDKNLKVIRKEVSIKKGVILFDPDLYKKELDLFKMPYNPLDESQILEYGKIASELRLVISKKADQVKQAEDDDSNSIEESKRDLPSKIKRTSDWRQR